MFSLFMVPVKQDPEHLPLGSLCGWLQGCLAVIFLLFCTLALGRMVLCVCVVFTSLLFFSLAKSSYPYFQLLLSVRALCPRRAHYCLQNSIPDSNRAWLLSMTTITLKTASWCLRGLQHLAWPLVKGLMKGTDK